MRLVSPMTRPGSSPRASGGAWSTDARRPVRSRSAAAATGPGWRQDLRRPADRQGRDPVVGAARWARAGRGRAPWPATRAPAIAGSPVSSTGALVLRRMPRASSTWTVASRSTTGRSPRPGSTTGSPVTTATAVTAARSAARDSTPPRARSTPCAGGGDLEHHDQRHREQHRPEQPQRRSARRAGATATSAPRASSRCRGQHEVALGASPRAAAATAQASTAGPSSRRSVACRTRRGAVTARAPAPSGRTGLTASPAG